MATPAPDVVIVGAGAAGCVLANRLSADPGRRVLLLEAGGGDRHPFYAIPLGLGRLRTWRHNNWAYRSEPEPGLLGRSLFLHQGKVLGGSSAINGMVYARAPAADLDGWAVPGWSYAELLPYARRAEEALPVRVRPSPFPLDHAFVAAGAEAGYPLAGDFNRPAREGFGFFAFNIRNGRRATAAASFLRPAEARPNLTVLTGARAVRIAIERGRATGVAYAHRGRAAFAAAGEVVLCAGAFNSPQMLMLSGVGDAAALRALGIAALADRPEVGAGLQNHVDIAVRQACAAPGALYSLMRADRIGLAMARAWLFGTGPATTFPGEAGAYVRSRDAAAIPDLQLHLVSFLAPHGVRWRPGRGPLDRDGFSCRAILLRPQSRGRVSLRAADPLAPPRIELNYLTAPSDLDTLRRGVRLIRAVLAQPALAALRGPELAPGPDRTGDAELEAWIRAQADTQGHPAGTCRLGADPGSVVDPELRVRGVERLRVADASVMPAIVGANTFATTVAIAEKAADLIRGPAPPIPGPSAGSAATGSAPGRS